MPNLPNHNEPAKPSVANPFEQICLFLADPFASLSLGKTINSQGFHAWVFFDAERLIAHLQREPLTAGVFLCGGAPELAGRVSAVYRGPLTVLPEHAVAAAPVLLEQLRELHRNQLKIQDIAVLRVLKALQAFLLGRWTPMLMLGSANALGKAAEYLSVFSTRPGIEEKAEVVAEGLTQEDWLITRHLFQRSVPEQQAWGASRLDLPCRLLILVEGTLNELDEQFGSGSLDEYLYEKLAMGAIDVGVLERYEIEELCLQPPESGRLQVIFDTQPPAKAEAGSPPPPPSSIAVSETAPAGSKSLWRGLLGRR